MIGDYQYHDLSEGQLRLIARWWKVRHLLKPLRQYGASLGWVVCTASPDMIESVSWKDFETAVEHVEAQVNRKPPGREDTHAETAETHPATGTL